MTCAMSAAITGNNSRPIGASTLTRYKASTSFGSRITGTSPSSSALASTALACSPVPLTTTIGAASDNSYAIPTTLSLIVFSYEATQGVGLNDMINNVPSRANAVRIETVGHAVNTPTEASSEVPQLHRVLLQ